MSLIGRWFGDEIQLENKIAELKESKKTLGEANQLLSKQLTGLKNKYAEMESNNKKTIEEIENALKKEQQEFKTTEDLYKKELERMQTELQKTGGELQQLMKERLLLSQKITWQQVGREAEVTGYRGVVAGDHLEIIKIKDSNLNKIPINTENGYDVYEDGDRYPLQLMDILRTKRNEIIASPIAEVIEPSINTDIKTKKEEISQEETNNWKTDLKPNQNRVLEYIGNNPNSYHTDIADDLKLNKKTLSNTLKSLAELDLIEKDNQGGYIVCNLT